MSYLRCTACGAKALSAATQCPRCTAPFALTDAHGRRVRLTACRGCGYLHRADTPCHWCGVLPPPTWRQPAVQRRAAAAALLLVAGAAVWRFGFPASAPATRAALGVVAAAPPLAEPERVPSLPEGTPAAPAAPATTTVTATPRPVAVPQVAAEAAPAPFAPADSGVRWVPAVARTWVNVRSNASRDGEVVGVISPDSKALLETGRAGWRRVRAPLRGWVDGRLFVADSTARRDG